MAMLKATCYGLVNLFLSICERINFPVSMEKTHWGCRSLTFLGLLIDTVAQLVCIPVDKVECMIELVNKY